MKPEFGYENSKKSTAVLSGDVIKIKDREDFALDDVLKLVKKRKKQRKNKD